MNSEEFRNRGHELIDYLVDYHKSLTQRRVIPSVEPRYLSKLMPSTAPEKPESWERIMADLENLVMSGTVHWQHPYFAAYFPVGCSYPSILAGLLSNLTGGSGFSWSSNPSCTELEMIVMDWYGKALDLPNKFLRFAEGSTGGGVIQNSTSESILFCIFAARHAAIKALKQSNPSAYDCVLLTKLVAYCTSESHSCIKKGARIALVTLRILEPDERYALRGAILRKAIEEDKKVGLVPFLVLANFGTTSTCACDVLSEIGPICEANGMWLHIDAAYAGNSLVCEELRYLAKGIHFANSISVNAAKWFLANLDASVMFVDDRYVLTDTFLVDSASFTESGKSLDFRHWGTHVGRRFRALKLYFIMKHYGIKGIQRHIRNHVNLAKQFEYLLLLDGRFERVGEVRFGLVCFRLLSSNVLTKKLIISVNTSGKLHLTPSIVKEKFIIRYCVCAQDAKSEDIVYAWNIIEVFTDELLLLEKKCSSCTSCEIKVHK